MSEPILVPGEFVLWPRATDEVVAEIVAFNSVFVRMAIMFFRNTDAKGAVWERVALAENLIVRNSGIESLIVLQSTREEIEAQFGGGS